MRAPFASLALAAATALVAAQASASPLEVPGDTTSAAATSAALDDTSFPVTLGSFSTTLLGSNASRTHNIRLAVAALDGVVLAPGDELSFNERVGPRTAERGYLVAPAILHEELQLQLGGGICQVASSIFDAALLAGLRPVERYRHSTPVNYVALGEDATISWGHKDLRLRNDLDQSVQLRVEVVGTTLLARIEGEQESDMHYDLVTEEREVPPSTDSNLPGREVELYRVQLVDGREVERELMHRDLYPSARIKGR